MITISKVFLLLPAIAVAAFGQFSKCDLNQDGALGVPDVQLEINEVLGIITATHDLNADSKINVVDIQIIINAALGLGCPGEPVPTITDFNPKSGPAGTLVTLTGTLLLSGTGTPVIVQMAALGGGAVLAPSASVTATSLTFVVPPGATTGPVKVSGLSATVTSSSSFAVTAATSFTLTTNPPSASVVVGQKVSYTVNLASANGFTQLAQLSVSGVPAGVTASFSPTQIGVGQQSVLTLSVPSNFATGPSNLTVGAAATIDGIPTSLTTSVTLNLLPITTSFAGRTVVSDGAETSLPHVKLTLLSTDGSGHATPCVGGGFSDASGNFLLNNLPAGCTGPQLIGFDGTTVTGAPGKYAGVNLVYTLTLGQVTTSPVLVHLPRIDNVETFLVKQNFGTIQNYSYSSIPGLSLVVYPGTTFTMPDGTLPDPFPLAAVKVPVDRLPDLKPPVPTMINIFIVAFQPANVTANQPVAVYYPNPLHTAAGTSMPLLTLDPTKGSMVPYGTGVVSGDGTIIVPDFDPNSPGHRYGIVHFDWHGPMPPPDDPNAPDDAPPSALTPWWADPVNLVTGRFQILDLDLPLNGRYPIQLKRTLTSGRAATGAFGLGGYHGYEYRLDTATPQSTLTFNLVTPDQHRYAFSRQADGTLVSSGTGDLQGAVATTADDGTATLHMPNGSILRFTPLSSSSQRISGLVSITDYSNATLTFQRDPQTPINITSITDPTGRSLKLQYDAQNRITSLTDPIGRTVTYTYDAAGHLASVTHPDGAKWQYAWDTGTNNLVSVTDPRNVVIVRNVFDGFGRVFQQVQADNSTLGFVYTLANPLVATSPVLQTVTTDQLGRTTSYRFNASGYLEDVVDPLGGRRTFTRDLLTNNLLAIGGNGHCSVCGVPEQGDMSYTYDAAGNRVSVIDAAGNTESLQYAAGTNSLTAVTNALNQQTTLAYDALGNVTQVQDPVGGLLNFTYDAAGRLTQFTDPTGSSSRLTYDSNGNQVASQDPRGNITQMSYDGLFRLVAIRDSKGQTTQYQFDAKDRVVRTTNPGGQAVSRTYDPVGNVQTVTDPLGGVVTYTYDVMERLSSVKDQKGKIANFSYDAVGDLISATDRRGQTSTFTYDALDRPLTEHFSDGSSIQRVYDAAGRTVRETDSVSGVFEYAYDATGHVAKMITPFGAVTYNHDKIYQVTARQVTGQPAVNYTYDARGSITQISAGGSTIGFTYDARGAITGITRSNGVTTTLSYDAASHLTGMNHAKGGTVLDNQTMAYDELGNATDVNRSIGQTLTTQSTSATYDVANRVLTYGTRAFTSDNAGNRLTDSGGSGATSYTWDARNRLSSVSTPDGNSSAFLYDPEGNLIQRRVTGNGSDTIDRFLVDEMSNVAYQERVGGEKYTMLSGFELDQQFGLVGSAGTVGFALHDFQGNVVGDTDQTGNLVGQNYYEPFGQTTQTGVAFPFAFSSRPPVAGSLYNLRARYYDPTTGSFVSEDPLGEEGDFNLYRYGLDNPLTMSDPTGLLAFGVQYGGIAEGGGRNNVSVQASGGFGLFRGGNTGVPKGWSVGAWRSTGGVANYKNRSITYDNENKGNPGRGDGISGSSRGIYAGGGGSVWLSNAREPADLSGAFSQFNVNVGLGPINFGLSFGWGRNKAGQRIWIGSFSPPGAGAGLGASASAYKTNTGWTGGWPPQKKK